MSRARAEGPPGLVVVDKAGGMTSHDVVGRVRRIASTRKVGHAGTLDPMATGVLVLGVNRATRLLGHLSLTEKSYDAVARLGARTTTDDAEGETVASVPADHLSADAVREAASGFVGDLEQVPSSVSAVKIDGRRAYDRVRSGEQVELAARPVTVHDLAVHEVSTVGQYVDVRLSVRCTSGTYVRALARDLGVVLGVGGHLTALRRTRVGPFTIEDAHTLEELEGRLDLLGLDEVTPRCFPSVELSESDAAAVRVGRALTLDLGARGAVAVRDPDGQFLALYEQAGEQAKAVAVFV